MKLMHEKNDCGKLEELLVLENDEEFLRIRIGDTPKDVRLVITKEMKELLIKNWQVKRPRWSIKNQLISFKGDL